MLIRLTKIFFQQGFRRILSLVVLTRASVLTKRGRPHLLGRDYGTTKVSSNPFGRRGISREVGRIPVKLIE
ncbi:hypothetical protein TNCV_1110411 [Trichonephila clavipes]|nr:hypothetical protein TNCV_1110411 [Trichonephila clavipes]